MATFNIGATPSGFTPTTTSSQTSGASAGFSFAPNTAGFGFSTPAAGKSTTGGFKFGSQALNTASRPFSFGYASTADGSASGTTLPNNSNTNAVSGFSSGTSTATGVNAPLTGFTASTATSDSAKLYSSGGVVTSMTQPSSGFSTGNTPALGAGFTLTLPETTNVPTTANKESIGAQPGILSGAQPGVLSGAQPGVLSGAQPGVLSGAQPGVLAGLLSSDTTATATTKAAPQLMLGSLSHSNPAPAPSLSLGLGTTLTPTVSQAIGSTATAPAKQVMGTTADASAVSTSRTTAGATSTTIGTTATTTFAGSSMIATQPVTMTYRQLEENINKWTLDLEEQEAEFLRLATQVNAWDRLLIDNGEKITSLNSDVDKVKLDQQRLDHELDFIQAQQKELEEMLVPLEGAVDQLPVIGYQQHADLERERTYQMAEMVDGQLKNMVNDLKEIIEHLNSASNNSDTSDPLHQISKILNAHMNSLQWVDQNTALVHRRVQEIAELTEFRRRDQERNFKLAYDG